MPFWPPGYWPSLSASTGIGAVIIQVADAIVAILNDASLSSAFEATRAYVPVYSLAGDFDGLKVTVVATELAMATLSRRDDDWDYTVDVAVQQRVTRGEATEAEVRSQCDPLMLLVEEIADLFRQAGDLGATGARFVGLANPPIYDPAMIDQHGVFTSVLRLTFRRARSR